MKAHEIKLAREIYIALIGNPERYKYISELIAPSTYSEPRHGERKPITQEQATQKNIDKSVIMAKAFYATTHRD